MSAALEWSLAGGEELYMSEERRFARDERRKRDLWIRSRVPLRFGF